MPLSHLSTATLIAELLERRAQSRSTIATIERSLSEANNFQLSDARHALEVATAIAAEANLADPFLLMERNRHEAIVTPRQILHYLLKIHAGWTFERAALHCERDHATIMHSCRRIQGELPLYQPLIDRVLARLQPQPQPLKS